MPHEAAFSTSQSFTPEIDHWPKPTDEAFYGLAGDIVRTIEPHSEADPMALLVQTLVAFGNAAGSQPHFMAEADRHCMNLFSAFVGETAKARKGTSWGRVKQVLVAAGQDWEGCITSGLSSGEGLIWKVRDPIEKMENVKDICSSPSLTAFGIIHRTAAGDPGPRRAFSRQWAPSPACRTWRSFCPRAGPRSSS